MSIKFTHIYQSAVLATAMTATLSSCLKNDIPYPRIQADITAIAADGQTADAAIDTDARSVTLTLGECVDLSRVDLSEFEITEGARIVSDFNPAKPVDLTHPVGVTLALYQDYEWTISAQQQIERYFAVENQIGQSVIDVPGCRVVITVSDNTDLSHMRVTEIKLGPDGSTMKPGIEAGDIIDLSRPYETVVTVHGSEQLWTIYADVSLATVTTTAADAWSQVVWVYANILDDRDNGFEYRKAGEPDWTRLAKSDITYGKGTMSACIKHLTPETEYEVRAYNDSQTANSINVTTGAVEQLPDSDFEQWWLDGKMWCPWAEGGEKYWDSGNKGATTLGDSNTVPTDDTPTGHGRAAKLQSQFVGVAGIGKLAAGNIFVGSYVKTIGTNGQLSFGRPFTLRPTKVRGWFKYQCKTIDRISPSKAPGYPDLNYLIGRPDTAIVWCALVDSHQPIDIITVPKDLTLFNPAGPEVIAYGKMQTGSSVDNWQQFEFELKYVSTDRVPTHILMVGSASAYGDYFVGGDGSTMWLDDIELVYDY